MSLGGARLFWRFFIEGVFFAVYWFGIGFMSKLFEIVLAKGGGLPLFYILTLVLA
jgi:hypothetical protein